MQSWLPKLPRNYADFIKWKFQVLRNLRCGLTCSSSLKKSVFVFDDQLAILYVPRLFLSKLIFGDWKWSAIIPASAVEFDDSEKQKVYKTNHLVKFTMKSLCSRN